MIRGNRGQVLMLVGVMLVALVAFAALGIDTAFIYSVRHELQRCADSGALAGAAGFNPDASPGMTTVWAREYAKMDNVANAPLTDSDVDVSFPADNQIRVDTHRTVNLFFARIWPDFVTQFNRRTATAEWVVPDNIVRLVK